MNNTPRESDQSQGATVYSATPTASTPTQQPPLGTPGTSSVRVYDRPDKPQAGINITTIVLMLIALLVVGAIVWSVIM